MADTKISALTALDAFATGDLIPMVDDPAGTPATKKATIDQIVTFVLAGAATAELIRDTIDASLTAGTGITVTPSDGGNTNTIATTITQYTDEMARDVLGTALTAGTGMTITPNDGADTITVTLDTTSETERVQDIVGALLVDSTGFDVTYNDAGNAFAVALNGLNTVSATGAAADTVGYIGAPQNLGLNSGNVTLALTDSGKHLYHSDANARTLTIPANASVAFPVGTVIVGVNENGAGVLTVAITSDTLRWGSSTGSRSVAADGTFSIIKVASTVWRLTGDGIT